MRAVLKAMYQYAKLNEYIDRDLTEGLVYEWTNSTEQIHDRYSDEEIKTLWSKLYEINNVDIMLFCTLDDVPLVRLNDGVSA